MLNEGRDGVAGAILDCACAGQVQGHPEQKRLSGLCLMIFFQVKDLSLRRCCAF